MPRWANAFAQAPLACSLTLVRGPVTTAKAISPVEGRWRVPISSSPPQRNVNRVCMCWPHGDALRLVDAAPIIELIVCMGYIQAMNTMAFDLNLLKVLDAVLATCSVSAASRLVGLSQPATSAALARLRVGLGDPLLVRQGNRMVLSPRAERLAPTVRLIMREIEQV